MAGACDQADRGFGHPVPKVASAALRSQQGQGTENLGDHVSRPGVRTRPSSRLQTVETLSDLHKKILT